MAVSLLGGCQSPQPNPKSPTIGASPSVNAPSAVDVRTEANIIEMENRYIADKNSQPTHQHEAEVEQQKKAAAAKAAEAKAVAAKAAAEKAAKEKADEQAKRDAKEPASEATK